MKFSLRKRKVLIWILAGVLVIFLLNFFQKEVKSFFYSISQPLQRVFWKAGDRASDFFGTIVRIKGLKKENEELKIENQELLAKIAYLNELEKENLVLREALEVGLGKEFKLALAEVIGKDISQDFLLINKGADDGIFQDMPVITQGKVLIGKVEKIYNDSAKVMLISDKKSAFDSRILEKDIPGLVRGEGNFKLSFGLVPQDKEVLQGDVIITSSLGGVFPAGLLVGKVEEIKKSDVEPFQEIEIKSFFDIKELNALFLIK